MRDADPNESAVFDLGPDFDVDIPETFGGEEPKAPVPPVAPASEPTAPTPQVPPPGDVPAPGVETAQPAAQASQDVSRPASIQEMLQAASAHHDDLVKALAENVFTLSPADVEELEANAVGALPKVLARTYLKAQTSTLQMVQQLVPTMVQDQVHRMFQMARAEDTFYGGFPELKDPKFRNDIMTAARAIRSLNPKMSNDQLIQMAGNMVMSMHNIVRTASQPSAAPPAAAPPFAPAQNGAIVSSQPTQGANDFFSILSARDD